MLSRTELSRIRSDLEFQLMPDTCNILSCTLSSDGQGGMIEMWGTAVSNVICRLDWVNGKEVNVGQSLKPFTGWIFTVPYNTSIDTNNRIEHNGSTYSIAATDSYASWLGCIRIVANRL